MKVDSKFVAGNWCLESLKIHFCEDRVESGWVEAK